MLAIIETHPIQYHAPVYRALQQRYHVPVTVIYGSDFSVKGYYDIEFQSTFAWDTDLLSGYASIFLSRVSGAEAAAGDIEKMNAHGLRDALKNLSPKAVLINGYWPHFNRQAIYESWRLKLPIFFRGDTTDHAGKRSFLKSIVRDTVLGFFYQSCQKLLYVGKNSYQHYQRLGAPLENLIFSPHCVDPSPFRVDENERIALRHGMRSKLGISDKNVVLIYSGKLIRGKRPDLILSAVKSLPSDLQKNITVIFLGHGEMKGELAHSAAAEPQVKSVFPGFQNQSRLSEYYHAADILILPSQCETWGLVVNEALHHGVPCVVSDAVGCAPDLIDSGTTGEVFKSGSKNELMAAIQKAILLINRKDIRDICRKKMEEYTVEKAAEGIASAFYSVIGHS